MEICLLGALLFALSFAIQLWLLSAVKKQPFRWSGLLCPIVLFVLALLALTADESHSFISLKTFVSLMLAAAGLLALTGCGCAWLVWKLLLRGKHKHDV